MAKSAIPIMHSVSLEWHTVPGIDGAYYAQLNVDPATGACTWLIKQEAGGVFPCHNHPAWTEMILLDGSMSGPEGEFSRLSYQSCPPGIEHGPYKVGVNGMQALLVSEGPVWAE